MTQQKVPSHLTLRATRHPSLVTEWGVFIRLTLGRWSRKIWWYPCHPCSRATVHVRDIRWLWDIRIH